MLKKLLFIIAISVSTNAWSQMMPLSRPYQPIQQRPYIQPQQYQYQPRYNNYDAIRHQEYMIQLQNQQRALQLQSQPSYRHVYNRY